MLEPQPGGDAAKASYRLDKLGVGGSSPVSPIKNRRKSSGEVITESTREGSLPIPHRVMDTAADGS